MQGEIKSSSYHQLKSFKEQDPLGFVFFKMNKVVLFENKKIFFEMQLDILRLSEKQSYRGRAARPEVIELTVARETRMQTSIDKLIGLEATKFRRSELRIKYQGEKGQDEGGIKREWFTNVVKDVLTSDKFELNSKNFYIINSKKTAPQDLLVYKFLGRILGKALYEGLLVPAYLISPIFKLMLQMKLNFEDLEYFNEGYYDTYKRFVEVETEVNYADLIEFWIPEE